MTFCLGMRCADGLVGLADTRLTSGDIDYVVTGKKLFLYKEKKHSLFIMMSGLKSLFDSTIIYLNERSHELLSFGKIFEGVEYISKVIREIRMKEEPWLERGNLEFNLNCIVGGQYEEDKTAQMFRIYPEGSWTRVRRDTPFEIIGETKYGKPLLDRAFSREVPMEKALFLALLSFDSTWKSNPMVHPPIDIVTYKFDTFSFSQKRLTERNLHKIRNIWEDGLKGLVEELIKANPNISKLGS